MLPLPTTRRPIPHGDPQLELELFVGAGPSTAATGQPDRRRRGANLPRTHEDRARSFDPVTGDLSATITTYSTTDELVDDHIRFVLLEHDVTYQSTVHTRVTRDIFNDTISLAGAGNTDVVDASFDIDPGRVTDNLRAVVFVQREEREDKEVRQPPPPIRNPNTRSAAWGAGRRVAIGPSTYP